MAKLVQYGLYGFLRRMYHQLPLSQRSKWWLKKILEPIIYTVLLRKFIQSDRKGRSGKAGQLLHKDEQALIRIVETIGQHAQCFGVPSHWIALPFLGNGGAEKVALNFSRGTHELLPNQSIILCVTDRRLISQHLNLPEYVCLIVFDDYLGDGADYNSRIRLLHNLLTAIKPNTFLNINSEVAWLLIAEKGPVLREFVRLFACIFAFQFSQVSNKKIGYAASFLERTIDFLDGLYSDNNRFISDAIKEYNLTLEQQQRMNVLYQPCRLFEADRQVEITKLLMSGQLFSEIINKKDSKKNHRPQILWAGRLDEEKRLDLLWQIVEACPFADFKVFGEAVLDRGLDLPNLVNISYEGGFVSPLDWVSKYFFDAFVFTSKWEGLPNVLLEVATLGIPIIAPTVGGVGEVISRDTGYPLSETPSVEDYRDALLDILAHPIDALGKAACLRELVVKRHSWSKFVEKLSLESVYLGEKMAAHAWDGLSKLPEVSIIVPCYNQGCFLQQAVESILLSCSCSLEIIIVDDGSTEPNIKYYLESVKSLSPDNIFIYQQVNGGLSSARNKGLALARGMFIQFLDADDLLCPKKIDIQVAHFRANQELSVSVCNFLLADASVSEFIKIDGAIAGFQLSVEDFLYRWERGFSIPIHCGLFKRSLFENLAFDVEIKAKEDWLLWTTLALSGCCFGYIHSPLVVYRQHGSSMRRSYLGMGRAWLEAGLKIEKMLTVEERPIFFDSVVSWFEQCYRKHPDYRGEIENKKKSQSCEKKDDLKINPYLSEELSGMGNSIINRLANSFVESQWPFISVVIPIFNHFDYLQECFESLGTKQMLPFEVIIVDDCSTDQRVSALLTELENRLPRLRVYRSEKNSGISVAQNFAVLQAKGEYIAFLDCDDALFPDALFDVCQILSDKPKIDYLFTDRLDVDSHGKAIRVAKYGGYQNIDFNSQEQIHFDLFKGMVASHLKVIRRSLYNKLNGCDPLYSGVQDWDFALKASLNGCVFHYLPIPLYRHRLHASSVTRTDGVSQLCKSNIVLRKYLERKWLRVKGNGAEKVIFKLRELPVSIDELLRLWLEGKSCVVDTRGGFSERGVNFLREYNSYFDHIIWDDQKIALMLYGYLYSLDLLL